MNPVSGRFLVPVLLAASLPAGAGAAPGDQDGLVLHAAVGSVPGPGSVPRSILYLQVPLAGIRTAPGAAGLYLTAGFDGEGEPVTVSRVYRDLPAVERGGERFFETGLPVALPPGRYRGRVRIEDLETGKAGEVRLEVTVPAFGEAALAVSGPLFGVCDGKEGPGFQPHPAARYGDSLPGPCVALEVVDRVDPPDDAYAVRYEVRDLTGRKILEDELESPRSTRTLRFTPDIDRLGAGRYRIRVEVRAGDESERVEGEFEIDASRAPFLDEPDKVRAVLGYVATNRELTVLDEAPDDSLAVLWARFWARRDPTPGSAHNEAMAEFIDRVEEATRRFGAMQPGWESDMGRIYIRYGEPDRVEDPGAGGYRATTRIWYYDARGLSFVFRDVDGFGRFELAGGRD